VFLDEIHFAGEPKSGKDPWRIRFLNQPGQILGQVLNGADGSVNLQRAGSDQILRIPLEHLGGLQSLTP